MELYVPKRYVAQTDLEIVDNCVGKYTVGLGQKNMAFTDDVEDIVSIMMTVTQNLFEKYGIHPNEIGRLEIGTETLIDKSKSVKTCLMSLFKENSNLEGITSINACYGGTAALFNSVAWVESSAYDGRYALVVCGDIAVYEPGPARPTGGCGALAILVGPNAPLALEPGLRSTCVIDVYDFYKPTHSEYAKVDGKLSQWAYLHCLETCYKNYCEKYKAKNNDAEISIESFDFAAFHAPYNKLLHKALARLHASDILQKNVPNTLPDNIMAKINEFDNREVETLLRSNTAAYYKERIAPSCTINQEVGNCYTASVFCALLSLICGKGEELHGKRVMVYSYGSGSVASMYRYHSKGICYLIIFMFSVVGRDTSQERFSLHRILETVQLTQRLQDRVQSSVEEFSASLQLREDNYGKVPCRHY